MNVSILPTEQRNANTVQIDEVGTIEMLTMINNEDKKVAFCIEKHLPQIASAIDAVTEKFAAGGRIVYSGAGTSGRMGFMDSSECPPTFGIPKERVVSLIAGGLAAMEEAVEDAEDHKEYGAKDLENIGFSKDDILVGIAASGRTPYVIGAVEYAKKIGSLTVSITCNEDPASPLNKMVDHSICINAGAEALTGSTRMKAGTIQKMVLNMLSTGVMVKTGKVYSNLMVNVQVKNEKLMARAKSIVVEITGAELSAVEELFLQTNNDVSLSIFILLTKCSKEQAAQRLEESGGHIKKALAAYQGL